MLNLSESVALLCIVLILNLFICASAQAQEVLGPTGRPGDEPSQLPLERVFVREIRITGNTVFSAKELAKVTTSYVNRELTAEDMEALRIALTLYYVNRGYVNSGVILPDQTVTDGVITLHIIEGKLTCIEVEGNKWFRPGYIQKRFAIGAGPPLNIYALQKRLQLLQQDERIQRINAELVPWVRLSEGILKVLIKEENPVKVWLDFNNYQSPTVGAVRGLVTATHLNLTGNGDILSFTYGRSSGLNPQIDTSYTMPFTAYDTTVTIRYRKNDFAVVEEPFEALDIDSKSDIFGITLRHPFYRALNYEFALALTGEYLHNKTFLLGEPFSFSPGAVDGESTVTALRFSQEWIYRAPTQVIAVRSCFNLGIDALGATNSPSGVPDSQFFSWLFQFQWARRLEAWDIQTILRLDLQLANDPLLPLEQIAVGGRYSVRGYRENQLVRDNGFIASLETRIPVIRNKPWADIVQLAPFMDFGRAWNKEIPTPSPKTIGSVGLGLRWEATLRYPFQLKPQFEIYWGVPLRDVKTHRDNLQDRGIHFRFLVAAF